MEGRGEKTEAEEEKVMEESMQFSKFFYPKNIVQNCLSFGYEGEVLPVGLRKGVAFGQRIYPSLEEIDRDIDLAVILTPAKSIPGILEQCGRKGIKWAGPFMIFKP